jgi:hypothetical protein
MSQIYSSLPAIKDMVSGYLLLIGLLQYFQRTLTISFRFQKEDG